MAKNCQKATQLLNFVLNDLNLAPSYDIVIGDPPGTSNQGNCWDGNKYNGRYIPVGSYESRVLYQRHTLDSNGKKVFLFYDQNGLTTNTVSWTFTQEDYFRTADVWQTIAEFNEAFGGLFYHKIVVTIYSHALKDKIKVAL